MSAYRVLAWGRGIYAGLIAVVAAALGHDIATEHHRHDREGD